MGFRRYAYAHVLLALCLSPSGCSTEDGAEEPDQVAAADSAPVVLEDLDADGALFGGRQTGGRVGNQDGGGVDRIEFEYKPLQDAAGRTRSYLPLPKNWRLSAEADGKYRIEGPHGIVVNPTESAEYAYADDPFALESLQLAGKQIAPVLSVQRIIEEGIAATARAQGYRLVDTYPLPELEKFWRAFSASMPRTGSQQEYHVVGTDWKTDGDERSLIVLLQAVIRQGAFVTWSVHTTELEAPAAVFDGAKAIYLDGLANMKMDADWQRAQGHRLVEGIRRDVEESQAQMRASAARHRQRMADIEAFGRTARAVGESNAEILDQSHTGFRERSALQEAGQAKSVQAIQHRTTVRNPETGKRYEVRAGYKYYWGDGRGGYFGTDDPNYDPRTDPDLNDREWVKFETNPPSGQRAPG